MSKFTSLRSTKTLVEFAPLLGFTPSGLSYVLYKRRPETLYTSFDIPKKSGGFRTIHAPIRELKLLQRRLADLLYVCSHEIETKYPVRKAVSHGFSKDRSIVTNASHHRNRRYVLSLDITDFFGSINFGRVRGYFIHDREFKLNPTVATIIAQIACYKNAPPQGSPCSPIISNLIGSILDQRLIALDKQHGCAYTRYADDLTFSTRLRQFPHRIAFRRLLHQNQWRLGRDLKREIARAGFSTNPTKTRKQIIGSRQVATGLVVNEKVNINQDYYRFTRSMCYSLFETGTYHQPGRSGSISDLSLLEGRLAFIHCVKCRRDRSDDFNKLISFSAPRAPSALYKRFLLYKYFVANQIPTLITEGRSDIIYISEAIKALSTTFPALVMRDSGRTRPKIMFVRHSKTNESTLGLGGGTGGIAKFIHLYRHEMKPYGHAPKSAPIVILIDNDDGADCIFKAIKSAFKITIDLKSTAPFYHLDGNLYLVKTPVGASAKGDTCMEDLFPAAVLDTKIGSKSFDKNKLHEDHSSYGKIIFADRVVRPNASKIDFSGFKGTLQSIADVLTHYRTALAKSPASAAAAP